MPTTPPGECWVCGRVLAPDEPRRLVPIVPDAAAMPARMSRVACLGCFRGHEPTSVPGAAQGRLTSRVWVIPAVGIAS